MENLKVNTSKKRILINDGPEYLEFDPEDVLFIERFYNLIAEFELKQNEFGQKAMVLDANKGLDKDGIPVNLEEGLAFIKEVCQYLRVRIDYVFGAGTSQILFGDSLSLAQIGQFFEGITQFIGPKRSEKLSKYLVEDKTQPVKQPSKKTNTGKLHRSG